jgi:hypothetical protein
VIQVQTELYEDSDLVEFREHIRHEIGKIDSGIFDSEGNIKIGV